MVRYYGFYSNASRGKRKKLSPQTESSQVQSLPPASSKLYRKRWSQLIRKVYEANPLLCPRCNHSMRIIAFILDPRVIVRILAHMGLTLTSGPSPPLAKMPPHWTYEPIPENYL